MIAILSRRLKGEFKNLSQIKEADMRKFLFLTFFAIAAPMALAQDPVSVDAKHYKVMFENDQVRVLRIHYNPKEKSVMHEHPASVVVFLNTSKAKFTMPDGTTTTDGGGKAGSVRFAEAGKHLPEDIGATPIEGVLVELKGKSGMSSAVALDPVKIDPTRHKVEVENDRVRVLRIKLKAHDKTKEHEHPNSVAIFLTDVKAKISGGDGKTRESSGKRGAAIWGAAEKHSVSNMSARPAEIILVELK
jgi:quercetin dioxygenase-like cupin family protein